MDLSLAIPFIILLILVVYLIKSRSDFEKETIEDYEKKFEEWKEHAKPDDFKEEEPKKELVGLIFKESSKIEIEMYDDYSALKVESRNYDIKIKS